MSREFVPAQWSVNTDRMVKQIRNHYVKCLRAAEDKLAELLRNQIPERVVGEGPGDPAWIPKIQASVRTLYRDIADSYIEIGVGLPYKEGSYNMVRAMVIEAGAGSAAGNPPIQTRPGEKVWNDSLSAKKTSTAQSWYYLPDGFNQPGNQFVENAMKLMSKHFDDVLADASLSLPDSIIFGNITTKKGART